MLGDRSLQRRQHRRRTLVAPILARVLARDIHLRHTQVERGALLHTALAEARKHVADVVEEHLVRAHHQHPIAHEAATVLEQQVRSAVQADGGLACARAALHHEALGERGADHFVLLGLDGGDDLAHRTRASRTDLGQHGVGDTRTGRLVIGVVELFVEVGRDRPFGEREPAAVGEAERVGVSGAVERGRDRCPPVDHHRIVPVVLDVASADVPGVADGPWRRSLLDDAAEEVAGTGSPQVGECFGDGDLDVLLGDLVGSTLGVERGEALDHPVATGARVPQVRLLGSELGKGHLVHRGDTRYRCR